MRKLFKSIIVAGLMAMAANVFADNTVAVMNLNDVFQQVPQGQAAFNQLQKQNAPTAAKLQKQQDDLNQQLQALQANKANLTPAQQSAQGAQLLTQQEKVQKSISDYQASLDKQQKALLTSFGNAMNAAVAQIAKKNGYHVVFGNQNMVYSDGSVDITAQVVKIMKDD